MYEQDECDFRHLTTRLAGSSKNTVAVAGDLMHVEPLAFFPPAMLGAIPEVCLMNH